MTISGHKSARQLTAGDGYFASNERKLVIGVAAAALIEELTIRWSSGMTTTMRAVPSNQAVTLIEGHSSLIVRPASHG
ncbi:MAG: ASPIC/UnbV domain-containing protein [Planctomycetaceae bacterium]|nr:ASPIC/UnbV domain-containing protein [Planctomycetaceae bacterium]